MINTYLLFKRFHFWQNSETKAEANTFKMTRKEKQQIRILFFISVHGHGRGGHHHDLDHISRKLGESCNVRIIILGPGYSEILYKNPYFFSHTKVTGINFLEARKNILKAIEAFKPDIFHFFDEGSYSFVRLFIKSDKNKIVVNKCGGPNPERYSSVNNLILFSQENLEWFKSNMKFKNTNIYYIPNRVSPVKVKKQSVEGKDTFNFIRICRICIDYKKSIHDSINLIEYLHDVGLSNTKLFIIGVVEDKYILNEIQKNHLVKENHVTLLTEEKFTTEAAKMLFLGDAVVGTGRGAMEAASLGKPFLSINSKDDFPVLIMPDNFSDAFRTNFSERNIFPSFDSKKNLRNIELLVTNPDFYKNQSIFAKKIFDEYFNIDTVTKSYSVVYETAKFGKQCFICDAYAIARMFFNFYKSYRELKSRNQTL